VSEWWSATHVSSDVLLVSDGSRRLRGRTHFSLLPEKPFLSEFSVTRCAARSPVNFVKCPFSPYGKLLGNQFLICNGLRAGRKQQSSMM
jgi:hypothetical protein